MLSPAAVFTLRPSAASIASFSSAEVKSTTRSFTASVEVMAALSRTAFSAQSAFRPRAAATLRAKAAVSFSTFFAMSFPASSATSRPLPVTGWAAPMLEVGCIAATSAASVRNTPAEPARAPAGPTHTRIGTCEPSIAWTISRVASSAPPGVERDREHRVASRARLREPGRDVLGRPAGDRSADLEREHPRRASGDRRRARRRERERRSDQRGRGEGEARLL